MGVVSAIVPAAGLSRRMGGANKLLLPWQGTNVVGAVVRTLRGCGLDVAVVTGHDGEAVREAVLPARVVHNPDYADGLAGSIACGVAACPASRGYLIALGDMPGLSPEVVHEMIDRFESVGEGAIVAPVYDLEPDRLGHPVLFGGAFRDELLALSGDDGARPILRRHPESVVRISAAGILGDLDTPDDFRRRGL